jgi:RNA polymerase sigma-70 factor, ECF subfamily
MTAFEIPHAVLVEAASGFDDGRPDEGFAAFLHARCDSLEALASLHTADLYVAFLALAGRDDAVRELERHTRRHAEVVIGKHRDTSTSATDLTQTAMMRLLYGGPDGVPKLASYAGRAPLGAWLRVVVSRLWESEASGEGSSSGDEALARAVAPGDDPALEYLKREYHAAFKDAFARVVAELEVDDRTLLRQHYLDGLSIDALARLYHVHRATAARRIAAVRERVVTAVQQQLEAAVPIAREELASVMALIRSQLDLSLSRLFAAK